MTERLTRIGRACAADRRPHAQFLFDCRFDLFDRREHAPRLGTGLVRAARWSVERWVAELRVRPPAGENPPGTRTVVLARAIEAAHYRRIEANLARLLEAGGKRSGAPVCVTETELVPTRLSVGRALVVGLRAGCAVVRAAFLARSAAGTGGRAALAQMLSEFPIAVAYFYNAPRLPGLLRAVSAVVTINENWGLVPLALRAAGRAGIPTLHYPHGVISERVFPLVSRHQLFWNDRMAATFAPVAPGPSFVVGFLEGFRAPPPPAIRIEYDVLITSQYHGYRIKLTDDCTPWRDIFVAWREILAARPELRCIIKLHPSDGPADREALEALFSGLSDRVLILGGEVDLGWLLASCRWHSTVSSGSLFWAAKRGVPTVIFGSQPLAGRNIPFRLAQFTTAEELDAALAGPTRPTGPDAEWLSDEWTEAQFAHVVRTVLAPLPPHEVEPADA